MSNITEAKEVEWTPNMMVEILLGEPDDFLKVRKLLRGLE